MRRVTRQAGLRGFWRTLPGQQVLSNMLILLLPAYCARTRSVTRDPLFTATGCRALQSGIWFHSAVGADTAGNTFRAAISGARPRRAEPCPCGVTGSPVTVWQV